MSSPPLAVGRDAPHLHDAALLVMSARYDVITGEEFIKLI